MTEESENFEADLVPSDDGTSAPTPISAQSPENGSPNSKRRRLTSAVWKDFIKKTIDGCEYAFCKHCGAKYKSLSRNGTKALHQHLKKCLKTRRTDVTPSQPRLVLTRGENGSGQVGNLMIDRGPAMERGDGEDERFQGFLFNQEVAMQALASAIILHEYPLSMVKHIGFQRFFSTLQPFFRMVATEEIKTEIKRIHDIKKENVYNMLEKLPNRIAITADLWNSELKKSYLCISAHFLDECWVLQKCYLRFLYVPLPHTKETLWNHLTGCLLDCNIRKKISTITIGGFTSTNEINPANLKILDGGLLLDGKLVHMQCGAHVLKLLVEDGLSVIEKITEKIRDSVEFWIATPSREETFSNIASQLKITYNKKLHVDDANQWNSTYLMLQTSIYYKEVFTKLKERESLYTFAPTDEEWDLATDICGRIKLFYGAAQMFSGSKHISSNNYFPKVCEIKEALTKWIASPNELINKMASNMLMKFEGYWNSVHGILAIAAVLDPRYKLKMVEYFFIIIYGSNSWHEVERIRRTCYDLFYEYQLRCGLCLEVSSLLRPSETANYEESDHLSQYDQFVRRKRSYNYANNSLSELDRFLEDPVLPRTHDFDVLGWWRDNGSKYPTLQLIAQDFLAIPMSVVTSDPAFSIVGRVLPSSRSRLRPDTVEALVCSHNWMWNEMEGTGLTADSPSTWPTQSEDHND